MKLEIDVSDEFLDAIAARVVAAIAAEGGKVTSTASDEGGDKDKGKGDGKAPAKKAPPKGKAPKRDDVLAKIREYGAKEGKDKAKTLISKYAEAFGEVKDEDLPALLEDVTKALAGEAPAAEEEEGY